jgi:hypothetical protein
MTIPRFRFDPAAVQSGALVLPKDDYEFIVGEPKVFARKKTGTDIDSYGLMFPLLVASEGEFKGKRIFVNFYMHSEGALPMLKAFQLAVFGFTPQQEREFNAQYPASEAWDVDFETKTVGDNWKSMTGQRVCATALVVPNQQSGDDQNNFRWRPV